MNWFQRHLNYIVVLSWLAAYLLFIMLIAFGAFVLEPYMNLAGIAEDVFLWLVLITFVALPLIVAGWELRRKGRSLWWLLIFFVPFGWIVFLCLENRTDMS